MIVRKFHYQAYGVHGDLAQGTLEATSPAAAQAALQLRGLTALQLGEERSNQPWWQREVTSSSRSTSRQLPAFTRELATLVDAGLPIDRVLRLLADHGVSHGMRKLASDLLSQVQDGAALSLAMQRHPRIFAPEYVSIVRAGEIGGTMGKVLQELADLLEHRRGTQAEVQSALIYPAIVALAAVATLAIVVGALVPTITSTFAESGRRLPPAVQFLAVLQAHGLEILSALAGMSGLAAVGVMAGLRRPGIARRIDRMKLSVPWLGKLSHYREAARYTRTFGTLLGAGVPLVEASQAARDVVANRFIAAGLHRANELLREGASLRRVLSEQPVLPQMVVQTIAIGEEAGKLGHVLLRIADTCEQQSRRSAERFMTVLAPALTVVMAIIVGGILMTVMSAILSINELAAQ